MGVEMEFYYWIDAVDVTGIIAWPERRARAEIGAAALQEGKSHGRITMWLWQRRGRKMAFAMARIGGDGAERPARLITAAAPTNDDAKAQMVYDGERE